MKFEDFENTLTELAVDFGALGYDTQTMAVLLKVSELEVVELMKGEFGRHYEAGVLKIQYAIDKKLLQLAKGGDFKAIEILEKRRSGG